MYLKPINKTQKRIPPLSLILIFAFLLRAYPYFFMASGWIIEDGSILNFLRIFLSGNYNYIQMYPHTALVGMSLLIKLGLPLELVAKIWGPLMGLFSTYFVYKILCELNLQDSAIYGAFLFSCLESNVYRSCSLNTTVEATGIVFSLFFIWMWHKDLKWCYFLLPLIAYTHYIVFGATLLYLFAYWYAYADFSFKTKLFFGGIIIVGFLVIMKFLPIGYALIQLITTFNGFDILKPFYIYSLKEYFIIIKTLCVTAILFFLNLRYNRTKHIKTLSWLYLGAIILAMMFHSPIVSPYRFVVHLGFIGIIGFTYFINKKPKTYRKMITLGLCVISLFQIFSFGFDVHNHFNDCLVKDEIEMINWIKQHDPEISYSHIFWDDVGTENLITSLPIIIANEPYSTKEKDYALWHNYTKIKQTIINKTIEYNYTTPKNSNINKTIEIKNVEEDPTPPHIFYVFYSKRFSERALIRLPDSNGRLLYKNYIIEDIWKNSPLWVLIYEQNGNKIYERK